MDSAMTGTSGYATMAKRRRARGIVLVAAALLAMAVWAQPADAALAPAPTAGGAAAHSVARDPAAGGDAAYQEEEPTATPTPQLYREEEERREDVIIPIAIVVFAGITVLGILFGIYGYLRE